MPEVTIEFYGIPRERAGRTELRVRAATVADALAAAERQCPGLRDLQAGGRLAPHYRLSVDGQRFVTEMSECVTPGMRLLLLSADAGG